MTLVDQIMNWGKDIKFNHESHEINNYHFGEFDIQLMSTVSRQFIIAHCFNQFHARDWLNECNENPCGCERKTCGNLLSVLYCIKFIQNAGIWRNQDFKQIVILLQTLNI